MDRELFREFNALCDEIIAHGYNSAGERYGLSNKYNTITENRYGLFIEFKPTKIIFNNPATIVYWEDGTRTTVKCHSEDKFDPEKGLAMALIKKVSGNSGAFNEILKEWLDDAIYQGV